MGPGKPRLPTTQRPLSRHYVALARSAMAPQTLIGCLITCNTGHCALAKYKCCRQLSSLSSAAIVVVINLVVAFLLFVVVVKIMEYLTNLHHISLNVA